MKKRCRYCGEVINNPQRRSYCSYACFFKLDKKIYGTQLTYEEAQKLKKEVVEKNQKSYWQEKKEKVLDQVMQVLAKRYSKQSGFLQRFDSVEGIKKPQENLSILDEKKAKQIGLEAVFKGGQFYWQPKTKALYIKHKEKYIAITTQF